MPKTLLALLSRISLADSTCSISSSQNSRINRSASSEHFICALSEAFTLVEYLNLISATLDKTDDLSILIEFKGYQGTK
jgi:hypothetical protein